MPTFSLVPCLPATLTENWRVVQSPQTTAVLARSGYAAGPVSFSDPADNQAGRERTWNIEINPATPAEKAVVDQLIEDTAYGAGRFAWTPPRSLGALTFILGAVSIMQVSPMRYAISLQFEEVRA